MLIKERFASMNDFYEAIYDVVRAVPYGRVTTYGAIAEFLSLKSASRFVGWALNAVHHTHLLDVPAHRVVNRVGVMTGKNHFGENEEGQNKMQLRLEAEGIEIVNDQIVHFDTLFWHPSQYDEPINEPFSSPIEKTDLPS